MNYYLSRDNKSHGPYNIEQLSVAAKNGKLGSHDKLSGGPKGPWINADKIPELCVYFKASEPVVLNPYTPKFTQAPVNEEKAKSYAWLISSIAALWITSILLTIFFSYFVFSPRTKAVAKSESPAAQPQPAQPQPEQPKAEVKEEAPVQNTESFSIKGIHFGMPMNKVKNVVNSDDTIGFFRYEETNAVSSNFFLKAFTIGGIGMGEGCEYGWFASGESLQSDKNEQELQLAKQIAEIENKLDNQWTNGLVNDREQFNQLQTKQKALKEQALVLQQEISDNCVLTNLEWQGASTLVDQALDSFTKAYGDPKITNFKSSTKAGVELSDYIATWDVKGVRIAMQRHISRDNGKIVIMPLSQLEKQLKQSESKREKAANDF